MGRKADDDKELNAYRAELGRMGLEDLVRQLCFQLERQRQATERVAEALETGGKGNLLSTALKHFAPRRG